MNKNPIVRKIASVVPRCPAAEMRVVTCQNDYKRLESQRDHESPRRLVPTASATLPSAIRIYY